MAAESELLCDLDADRPNSIMGSVSPRQGRDAAATVISDLPLVVGQFFEVKRASGRASPFDEAPGPTIYADQASCK